VRTEVVTDDGDAHLGRVEAAQVTAESEELGAVLGLLDVPVEVLLITSRTRSGLVKVTLAIPATSIPCTDKSTICALRQVTTDPDERRTIRSSLLPSSAVTSRTDRRSLDTIPPPCRTILQTRLGDRRAQVVDSRSGAKVRCCGTR
jgi:hypothetical protein